MQARRNHKRNTRKTAGSRASDKPETLIPLRFVAQAMGASVRWDGKNQQVLIATK
ncbi:stalk domain-containing protein [Paenibacillus luteus]|uniref:stalk domain-containing protein n=1 Tax=Paenibacillus luteus TaxID=2545753 RepID=UPI0011433073|nr:stalk domain-containing protein [Paenibacillus luteus]